MSNLTDFLSKKSDNYQKHALNLLKNMDIFMDIKRAIMHNAAEKEYDLSTINFDKLNFQWNEDEMVLLKDLHKLSKQISYETLSDKIQKKITEIHDKANLEYFVDENGEERCYRK